MRRKGDSWALLRMRIASDLADISLKIHRYPFGVQQSLMTRLWRGAHGGNERPENCDPRDQEDPGNDRQRRHAQVRVTQHEPGDRHPSAGLARLLDLASGHVPEDDRQRTSQTWAEQPRQDAAYQGDDGHAVRARRAVCVRGWVRGWVRTLHWSQRRHRRPFAAVPVPLAVR